MKSLAPWVPADPPSLNATYGRSFGEVSPAFAAKRLLRDHAKARLRLKPSGGGP